MIIDGNTYRVTLFDGDDIENLFEYFRKKSLAPAIEEVATYALLTWYNLPVLRSDLKPVLILGTDGSDHRHLYRWLSYLCEVHRGERPLTGQHLKAYELFKDDPSKILIKEPEYAYQVRKAESRSEWDEIQIEYMLPVWQHYRPLTVSKYLHYQFFIDIMDERMRRLSA